MALTGTLSADFSSFVAAVEHAEVKLRGFEQSAGKVETALNRVTNSLSGTKIIQEATIAVEAVNRIGGATKLTEQEQAKLNATLTEALAKYAALGQEAPASMVKLHEETSKVKPEMDKISTANGSILSSLAPLAGAFGITFSIGAVVAFGRALLDDADALVKLSDKTGIALEPLQRLKFIGEQTSVTIEQMTAAINQMQRRLANGDDSAVGALNKLGISLSDFLTMTPDEKFMALARAVAEVEDPMQRVDIAMDLMGRTGADVLPALIADVDALAEQSTVMSEGTVQALDRVGDTFTAEWSRIKTITSEVAGAFAGSLQRMGDAATALVTGDFGRIHLIMAGLADVQIPKTKSAMDGLIPSTKGVALAMGDLDRIGKELTTTTERNIEKSTSFKRAQDALFGRDIIQRALDYADQLGSIDNLTRLTTGKKRELKAAVEAAQTAYEALGEQVPPKLSAILRATDTIVLSTREFNRELLKWEDNAKVLPPFTGLLVDLETKIAANTLATGLWNTGLRFTAETIESFVSPAIEGVIDDLERMRTAAEDAFRSAQRTLPSVNPFTGEGAAGTDPRVLAYMREGYTLGEAMALVGGYGFGIGRPHGYWDATGWHEGTRPGGQGTFGGNMAATAPAMFSPPRSLASGASAGAAPIIINTGHVIGTQAELARLVGDALASHARGAMRFPASV